MRDIPGRGGEIPAAAAARDRWYGSFRSQRVWGSFSASASSSSFDISSAPPQTRSLSSPLISPLIWLYNLFGRGFLSPFRMMCRGFILSEHCKPCPFLSTSPFAKFMASYQSGAAGKLRYAVENEKNAGIRASGGRLRDGTAHLGKFEMGPGTAAVMRI